MRSIVPSPPRLTARSRPLASSSSGDRDLGQIPASSASSDREASPRGRPRAATGAAERASSSPAGARRARRRRRPPSGFPGVHEVLDVAVGTGQRRHHRPHDGRAEPWRGRRRPRRATRCRTASSRMTPLRLGRFLPGRLELRLDQQHEVAVRAAHATAALARTRSQRDERQVRDDDLDRSAERLAVERSDVRALTLVDPSDLARVARGAAHARRRPRPRGPRRAAASSP